SISKNLMPLQEDFTITDFNNSLSEFKTTFLNGKTSIINTLALKNIEASLNNTLVELSEKIKLSFDSGDASIEDLTNKLTQANNTINQLNSKYKTATGFVTPTKPGTDMKALTYNRTFTAKIDSWININNLGFKPNIFIAEYDYINNSDWRHKLFIFACCNFTTYSSKDFVFICDLYSKGSTYHYTSSQCGLYESNKYEVQIMDNSIQLPAFEATDSSTYYRWHAIKIY
ncbi:glycine rich domain-containing protein, partial [Clostridioides difficile]